MRVGDLQEFEDALDRPVLAIGSVERVERHIRPDLAQPLGDVVADIQLGHLVAAVAQGLGAALAGTQRHRTLVGDAAP